MSDIVSADEGAAPMVPERALLEPRATWAAKIRAGLILFGLFLAMLAAPHFQPFSVVETWLRDMELALLAPAAPPHPGIAIVDINEQVLAKLEHRSPIDRSFLARVISAIATAEPAAIGVDVLIDQPSNAEDDAALLATLRWLDVPLVLAWAENASAPNAIGPKQEQELRAFFAGIENQKVIPGAVNLKPDADGVVRNAVLHTDVGTVRDGFALALGRAAGISVGLGVGDVMPLAYYGHPTNAAEPFNIIPADAFLAPDPAVVERLGRAVRDRIVVIGASLADTDRHRTPFAMDPLSGAPSVPGVNIHAHALAQLLDGRTLAAAPFWVVVLLSGAAVALGFYLGCSAEEDLTRTLAIFGTLVLMFTAALLAFRYGGAAAQTPGPTFPLGTTMLGFLTAATLGIDHERRRGAHDRRLIHNVLMRYLPEQAIAQQLKNPEITSHAVERREMSFVFSDIQGFTTLCESAKPDVLVPLLNEYLGAMTEIITAHNGTVGGFIGDAVVAFWGAPVPDPDHPNHAMTTAVAMDQAARAIRIKAKKQGLDFGRTRIGVHTGVASLGNFGGPKHLEYMAHGDAVNTTARLESANKFLGTNIVVSEVTAARVRDIRLRPVADLTFKGKAEELSVFEPAQDVSDDCFADYMQAYALLRENSPKALETFEVLHRRYPDDGLIEFHLKRLRKNETGTRVKFKRK